MPASNNFADEQTAGLFEFTEAYASDSPDEREPATHYNLQSDPFAQSQVRAFITSADENRAGATIIDPYAR